jgi:hypothetical protein
VCPGGTTRKEAGDLSPVLVVRICSRPGGTIEISWLKRSNLAKADPRLGYERRYSGVPPGRGPHVLPDPAINRWATVMSLRDEEPSQEALIFAPFGTDNDFDRPSGTKTIRPSKGLALT